MRDEHVLGAEHIDQMDAVQELLRWNPPVAAQPRFSRADREVEFEGRTLPANSAVLFGIAAANRDPEVYPDPDRFDIRRPKAARSMSFGHGLHRCLGHNLAKLEGKVIIGGRGGGDVV